MSAGNVFGRKGSLGNKYENHTRKWGTRGKTHERENGRAF